MKQIISLVLSSTVLTVVQVTAFLELSKQVKNLSTQVSGIQTKIK